MYKIEHLFKIFISKDSEVVALNNISLTLPDTGLIFITGISGSGKSTLLNQLGGLDKPTTGTILFNNINITELTEAEIAKYRNDYIGFVFQDFALIESMTVYDNIAVSLEMQNKNESEIDNILKELKIDHLKNRQVTKLSAGQKQRVSIARAAIKKPKVILADEPTGNLDSLSGKIVLQYLSKLAKDSLVIIISHNQNDAYQYADRIITLQEGNIINDLTTKEKKRECVKKEKILYLNDVKELDENSLSLINTSIEHDSIKTIRPIKDLFSKTTTPPQQDNWYNTSQFELSNSKLKTKNVYKLHNNLLKKQISRTIVFSLFSMILIVVFSLCQMLTSFSSDSIINESINNIDSKDLIVYKKGVLDDKETYTNNRLGGLTKEEINSISDAYFMYNFSFRKSSDYSQIGTCNNTSDDIDSIFSPNTSIGTLVTTKEHVSSIFDMDEIEYVCLADEYNSAGIYITDFLADCFILNDDRFNSYEQLLGPYTSIWSANTNYINGIIKTNYDIKFKDIISTYKQSLTDSSVIFEISNDELNEFSNYCRNYLKLSYSFEKNFVENISNYLHYPILNTITLEDESEDDKITFNTLKIKNQAVGDSKLIDTMQIPITILDKAYGKNKTLNNWNETLKDKVFTFTYESLDGETHSEHLKVEATNNSIPILPLEVAKRIYKNTIIPCAVYFKNIKSGINFYNANKKRFIVHTDYSTAADSIGTAIDTYKDLFTFIGSLLLIASLFLIFYMSYDSVKKKKYDIGVLKAIGMNNSDLYKVYFINFILQILFCAVFYIIFLFIFENIANNLLVASLKKLLSLSFDFVIFKTNKKILLSNVLIILCSSLLGFLIPIAKIKNIKPVDIIRSKY